MQRYFVTLNYCGTPYHGWQRQPNATTVQEMVEGAMALILREKVDVVGAGRTDTGVHARGMVAHFDYREDLDEALWMRKMNGVLPESIAIREVRRVPEDAHARFSAVSRRYEYTISTEKDPTCAGWAWMMREPLDFEKMNRAARDMLGRQDFFSLSKAHTDVKTHICNVMRAEWRQASDTRWIFTIQADRFLRNMVRATVGTLVDIGRGRLCEQDLKRIIEAKDRRGASSSAPAEGLSLVEVAYPEW